MTVLKFIALLLIGFLGSVMSSDTCLGQSVTSESCAVVPAQALDKIPTGIEIYQYDTVPLGCRQPIVMIHGLLGEFHPFFRWQRLAQYLNQDKPFRNRYKIYLVRYNTQSSRQDLTQAFVAALHDFSRGHIITVVTISMSGAIIRDAMKDPALNQSIAKVLTLGAFFHGSPLFCAEWMKETIRKTHFSPLTKEERVLAYDLYFSRHKNLLLDYKWRNADETMQPDVQPPSSSNESLDEQSRSIDRKFIVYAGFIRSEFFPTVYSALHQLVVSPWAFFHTTLPAHLGFEHPALRFLNGLIATSVQSTGDRQDKTYALNDGISPISSGLLFAHSLINTKYNGNTYFTYLKANSDAGKARVFANIDHLTFIEGRGLNNPSKDVSDVFSKAEEARPMFTWILNDLLEE